MNPHVVCILIVELHHDVGGVGHQGFGVTKDLQLVEDERLVPDGIQRVPHRHRPLGLVEERHDGVRVCTHKGKGGGC